MSRPGVLARGPMIPGEQPLPPDELTPEELQVWERITIGLPAERVADIGFQILGPLLCSHICHSQFWAGEINRLMRDDRTKDDLENRKELRLALKAHGLQSDKVASLATKLRLTPQGRYVPDTARLRQASSKLPPWADWGDRRSST
jgi:hypothetical protein